jgi:DHA1 family bicyclomycin/chloramphenicol resistance-like MFS transporter
MGAILTALILAGTAAMMSTHLYTPSLPHLADVFHASPAVVKLSLSFNALAFGFSQLIHGPLSDRFGRRPVMLGGMTGFILFSLACAFVQSINQLIVVRVFQGMSASVEAVLVLAIIHDLFDVTDRVRALAIYGMAVALAPATAAIIGGYVHAWLGWRANFVLIALIGLLALVLIRRLLPESSVPDKNSIKPIRILKEYGQLLTNPGFLSYAIISGAGSGMIMAFVTAGPFVLISYFNVAPQHYGLYLLMPVLAYICANLITKQVAGKIDIETLLRLGLLVTVVGAIILSGLIFSGFQGAVSLSLAMAVTTFGLGPVFAIVPMRALGATGGSIGVASALVSTIPPIMGGLASASLSVLHDGTSRPLALTVLGMLFIAGFAYLMSSWKN